MFKNVFCLSKTGSRNVIISSLYMTAFELASLAPVILLAKLAAKMLEAFYLGQKAAFSLWGYLGLSLVFFLLIYFFYRMTYQKKYANSGKEDYQLRMALADKIRKLPMSYLGQRDLSDLTSIIMDDVAVTTNTLANSTTELLSGFLSSIIALCMLAFVDLHLTGSLVLCLPLVVLAMSLSRWISEGTNRQNKQKKLVISDGFQEYLENIKVLRASKQMTRYQKNLSRKIKSVIPGLVLHELLAGMSIAVSYNIMRLGLGLVIITGSARLINGQISLFTFLLFLFTAVRIYEPLTKGCEMLGDFIYSQVSAGRIRELLDYPEQDGEVDIQPSSYDIAFHHVSFGYNREDVLHDVSFTAEQGQITALVGPSGCGKSTLCRLAARFWDVERGSVSLGGIDVNTVAPESLLKHYAFVFQDVVLFNDTIYNNIRIGRENASKEEVLAAARMAQCEEFILRLPQGYDTVIGENGKTLSGGERQRLSIARAFLKDAPVILLDESTASLDPENETKIQQALGRLIQDKTVLIIAHRLRSVASCDKIVCLDGGRVAEVGTHQTLMAHKGLYHKLYTLQNKSMEWQLISDN